VLKWRGSMESMAESTSVNCVTKRYCVRFRLAPRAYRGRLEGYEKELFDGEMCRFLARHCLIIEAHDFIDLDISSYLRAFWPARNRSAH
jgi:hypothetical protein